MVDGSLDSLDLQGAMTYCLIMDDSQMSTAAASSGSWRFSRNETNLSTWSMVVKDIGRGDPEASSMDAMRAVHFYLDGRRNSRSLSPKSKIMRAEHPCVQKKS